jgi:uncharacterized protein (DUF1800 family)
MATRAELAHLLRRATFGPTAEEVDEAERVGFTFTVANLVAPAGPDAAALRTPMPALGPDPVLALPDNAGGAARDSAQRMRQRQIDQITVWWLDRMSQSNHQFVEKLVFFWHGHWATAIDKVDSPQLMLKQQQVFRDLGPGDFHLFVRAMLRDPALIFWLDGQLNTRKAPNENLARELMELFTLGIGNYTETDVKQGAKALTGWQVDRAAMTSYLTASRHDSKNKTILGHTGNFGVDEYTNILRQQPAYAEFIVKRLWFRFVSVQPVPTDTMRALVDMFRRNHNTTELATAMFTDPNFLWAQGQLVKQPVEWLIGALRQLGLRFGELTDDDQRVLAQGIDDMGQLPFNPPSVGGWPSDTAWLNTSAVTTKLRLASLLAARLPRATADRLTAVPPGQRPDAVARLLVVDRFTGRTKAAMAPFTGDVARLVTLGLISPEYAIG